ncbi:hypothetical protein ACFQH5_02260 [Halomonas salifodinae]|uniref:Helix-hairpin-helix domain-containing protein n=1 Tax=Halomonas salifodinae TaxID=438745 RepID=A0ABW2ER89_9GAMM
MAFSESEKAALLEVKGVGPTVVKRFEASLSKALETITSCRQGLSEPMAGMLIVDANIRLPTERLNRAAQFPCSAIEQSTEGTHDQLAR